MNIITPDIEFSKRDLGSKIAPQSANWQQLPGFESLEPYLMRLKQSQEVYHTEVSMSFGDHAWVASVYCNNAHLLEKLNGHFSLRDESEPLSKAKSTCTISMLYLVDTDLVLDGVEVNRSPTTYNGYISLDGLSFMVSSIFHVGIFKSAIIGCWSAQYLKAGWLPVHSSIIVSPKGHGIVFSGKANWGKTTTLFAVLAHLRTKGYRALTDDWALISKADNRIVCVDKIVALRLDIIRELPQLFEHPWLGTVMDKFIAVGGEKPELPLENTLLSEEISDTAVLAGVVSLSPTLLDSESFVAYELSGPNDDFLTNFGFELGIHAYHCPDLFAFSAQPPAAIHYKSLIQETALSKLFTKVTLPHERRTQIEKLCAWIEKLDL